MSERKLFSSHLKVEKRGRNSRHLLHCNLLSEKSACERKRESVCVCEMRERERERCEWLARVSLFGKNERGISNEARRRGTDQRHLRISLIVCRARKKNRHSRKSEHQSCEWERCATDSRSINFDFDILRGGQKQNQILLTHSDVQHYFYVRQNCKI